MRSRRAGWRVATLCLCVSPGMVLSVGHWFRSSSWIKVGREVGCGKAGLTGGQGVWASRPQGWIVVGEPGGVGFALHRRATPTLLDAKRLGERAWKKWRTYSPQPVLLDHPALRTGLWNFGPLGRVRRWGWNVFEPGIVGTIPSLESRESKSGRTAGHMKIGKPGVSPAIEKNAGGLGWVRGGSRKPGGVALAGWSRSSAGNESRPPSLAPKTRTRSLFAKGCRRAETGSWLAWPVEALGVLENNAGHFRRGLV
jgi:hypothetical protein